MPFWGRVRSLSTGSPVGRLEYEKLHNESWLDVQSGHCKLLNQDASSAPLGGSVTPV